MVKLKRATGPDGREYWVDEHGIVHGLVQTGDLREDAEQYAERHKVEKLLAHWGWPRDSEIERPDGATYDYDCIHAETGERVAVEVKRVTLPQKAMTELHSTGDTEFQVKDFLLVPAERLAKANEQLSAATRGARRCVLLVSETEAEFDWKVLVDGVRKLDLAAYRNIDEVWLTTAHQTRFLRHL